MTKSSLIVNRRVLLGRAAAVGAGALVASAGLRETLAAPTAGGRLAARRFQGLTGEITVSYPDELGSVCKIYNQRRMKAMTRSAR
jgi:hypothetical protein